jgi:hypothetical protein
VKFQEHVEMKKDTYLENKENDLKETYTMRPKVDKKSDKIVKQLKEKENNPEGKVYDRLHKIHQ